MCPPLFEVQPGTFRVLCATSIHVLTVSFHCTQFMLFLCNTKKASEPVPEEELRPAARRTDGSSVPHDGESGWC